jgi:hypothetical protein
MTLGHDGNRGYKKSKHKKKWEKGGKKVGKIIEKQSIIN